VAIAKPAMAIRPVDVILAALFQANSTIAPAYPITNILARDPATERGGNPSTTHVSQLIVDFTILKRSTTLWK
jgi:hypothetical protein